MKKTRCLGGGTEGRNRWHGFGTGQAPILLFVLTPLLLACQSRGSVEEIAFDSGPFHVVGDLRLPPGPGPHPVVLFVHGDGPNSRTSGVTYPPLMERMLAAGYATFAWDKPGTGESTGQIEGSRVTEQRAHIVLDAIVALKRRADIDHARMGLWGISQAGYVMPKVLEGTDEVAFMIAVSCADGPGVEQGIYLLSSQMACLGHMEERKEELRAEIRAFTMAKSYEEFLRHREPFVDVPAFRAMAAFGQRIDIPSREEWHPADPAREYYGYDPMDVIRGTSIPILAVFGERDTQVDPVQGAEAWREALARAGNPRSRVVVFPAADHNVLLSETGCISERNGRSAAGWRNYPTAYLDLIEEWLTELPEARPDHVRGRRIP
ncbi:MAG: alpha/beta fold hydrolase [Gemmatimonadota bacterium]